MKLVVLAIASLLLSGCARRDYTQNPVTVMGLRETALGRQLTEDSIATTNLLLSGNSDVHLVPSWKPISSEADSHAAVVYLVDSTGADSPYMIFVPNACRCILIDPVALRKWSKDRSEAKPGMLAVSEANALSFMLLHEAGHIAHHNPGQFEESSKGAFNTSPTEQKQRETQADLFAVNQIQAAIANSKNTNAWLAAQNMSMDLANLFYNIFELRVLDHFGATTLSSPAVFADVGYTHPNFELRLLTANNMLANSETSKKLLHDFLERRSPPAAGSGALYERHN